MNSFFEIPAGIKDIVLVSTSGLTFVLGLWVVFLVIKLRGFLKKWGALLGGSRKESLEQCIAEQMDRQKTVEGKLHVLVQKMEQQELKLSKAFNHFGLVKFDAFKDIGGQQSFALAIHNESGDGILITSILGRQDCRVYAKQLKRNKAERELLKEEEEALGIASKSLLEREKVGVS
jgi:hypothetical protein